MPSLSLGFLAKSDSFLTTSSENTTSKKPSPKNSLPLDYCVIMLYNY